MSVRKVLIAHQSTIPYYRAPFYQAVERLRPKWWEFAVVYDDDEARRQFFVGPDVETLDFQLKKVRTYTLRVGHRRYTFQTFPFEAWKYDLIVVGHTMHNLSYPLSYLWHFGGKSIAYWGHGRDISVKNPTGLKAVAEKAKVWLACRSDGFFAYTRSVRDYMIDNGVDKKKIYTLYNTIDIGKQREIFRGLMHHRDAYRKQAGLDQKKVLLFVGRLSKRKRLGFLMNTFGILKSMDERYHLIIIGGGDLSFVDQLKKRFGEDSISYPGVVVDEKDISYFYIISDLFIFPGVIGLGPLQSLCYDLTPAIIDSNFHNPEYEYLNANNSLISNSDASCEEYARVIENHLGNREQWRKFRLQAWPSIQHLTIDNMANNFINGINAILST